MSKRTLTKLFWGLPVAVCLVVSFGSIWVARGIYDEAYMIEGRVHVVNPTPRHQFLELTFPSGEVLRVAVPQKGSVDERVGVTGEGAIRLSCNGGPELEVGYVTTMNGMIVLALHENGVTFSQVFP